eukprot:TRINITY_DN26769_c0_g1_i2.p1 TRINITY_DN26769_c0_g1~~TRINITY_DN26769_c0_g1_i2.p1  ORF type:complete len:140 (+),score=41.59 TRINITY_DN26769_c0_g1_i2:163-582(+)
MEEIVGLKKGAEIPAGTQAAIQRAWSRGNYVTGTCKQMKVMDGAQFYAATGNDYRGDFRSVDSVYIDATGDKPRVISKIVMAGPDEPPSGMSREEFDLLRKAAHMDASGQAQVIADPDHGGRPYVFAGINKADDKEDKE